MLSDIAGLGDSQIASLRELTRLRTHPGSAREFWSGYLTGLTSLTGASKSVLLFQEPGRPGQWKRAGEWPIDLPPSQLLSTFNSRVELLALESIKTNQGLRAPLESRTSRSGGHYVLTAQLKFFSASEVAVAGLLLSEVSDSAVEEALCLLELASDIPESYQVHQALRRGTDDVRKLAIAQELMIGVNAEQRFLAAALAFCNGLAGGFRSQRVSLGWLDGDNLRLRAISHTEKFDRKMAAIQAIETAMDEAMDQDEEILWPRPEGTTAVTRDHERLAREQTSINLLSVPIRLDDEPIAVVTFERREGPFTATELDQVRLCCDQAARRLSDLNEQDRWWGARATHSLKKQLSRLVGPKDTWMKVTALLMAMVLAGLFVVRPLYRVEGNFVLKSAEVSYRTAPFDGYIEKVLVRPGDSVKAGGELIKLVTRELELEEYAALAEVTRSLREAEKARANNDLAEMRIAQALADQAEARLGLVRYRLKEATLVAPFDGVIVEGDLRERLAAPVRQGDPLLKIARIDRLYAEAEVNERDVHEILNVQNGEIALVGQPKYRFRIRITKLEPAGLPRTIGNVFLLRCEFPEGVQPWWRPGMSGLCKLEVGPRPLGWILTHRTVDFLRLKLWW